MEQFDDDNEMIGKLLRLKRYEQPPPGYFENFLHEFHRRQRDELLRQPLWRICLDRVRGFVVGLNLSALTSYPAAVTAVLVCTAIVTFKLYQAPEPASVAVKKQEMLAAPVATEAEWTLASPAGRVFNMRSLRNMTESAQTHRKGTPPRYVLDSVPVSYETTFKF
jgi:hypothetical protein